MSSENRVEGEPEIQGFECQVGGCNSLALCAGKLACQGALQEGNSNDQE